MEVLDLSTSEGAGNRDILEISINTGPDSVHLPNSNDLPLFDHQTHTVNDRDTLEVLTEIIQRDRGFMHINDKSSLFNL